MAAGWVVGVSVVAMTIPLDVGPGTGAVPVLEWPYRRPIAVLWDRAGRPDSSRDFRSRDVAALGREHVLVMSGAERGSATMRSSPPRQTRALRVARRLAGLSRLLVVGAVVAAGVGRALNADVPNTDFAKYWPLFVFGGTAYGATGGWLAAVRPRLPLGWLMLAVGASMAFGGLCGEYAIAAVDRHPDWPG